MIVCILWCGPGTIGSKQMNVIPDEGHLIRHNGRIYCVSKVVYMHEGHIDQSAGAAQTVDVLLADATEWIKFLHANIRQDAMHAIADEQEYDKERSE